MATIEHGYMDAAREQLLDRRERLGNALENHPTEQLSQLLVQVDEALQRLDTGHFGECAVCHESVESDRLLRNPLISVCLGCLSPAQQRALEYDLELAARIQNELLPAPDFAVPGWQVAYHYRPAGVIGGDYFDVMPDGRGGAYFLIADVAGKGVAAAMLTANLRAAFRALVPLGLGVGELMARANHLFCESKLPTQYATVVFGHSLSSGKVELVNAGHLPALLVSCKGVSEFGSNDLPLGLFCDQQFTATSAEFLPGDMMVLYTDGMTEAQNQSGVEYGIAKLSTLVAEGKFTSPEQMVQACRDCVRDFRGAAERTDDETVMAIQFVGAGQRMVV
jgi:sigma-B regulation protein RsbU (phosphoserine phosphatase)